MTKMEFVLERRLAPHAQALLQPSDAEDNCIDVVGQLDKVDRLLRTKRAAEARDVLGSIKHCFTSQVGPSTPQVTPGNSPAKLDSDEDYNDYLKRRLVNIAATAKTDLHAYVTEGSYSDAKGVKEILQDWDPSYLDPKTEMEFFTKCQQVYELGSLEELASMQQGADRADHLVKALNVYNEGCDNIELRHWVKDLPYASVWIHDHDSCANLFFSAARCCILTNDLIQQGQCPKSKPRDKIVDSTSLEDTWLLQAVRYIERGRARGMRRTMESNDQLRDLLGSRESDSASPVGSSPIDTPNSPYTPLSSSREVSEEPPERHHRRKRSEDNWDTALKYAKRQRTNRTGLSLSVPVIAELRQQRRSDQHRKRLRARWRSVAERLLNAVKLRDEAPKLDLDKVWQCVPEDTVVIEYALSTLTPMEGLITIVSTRSGVDFAGWQPLSEKGLKCRNLKQMISDLHKCLKEQVESAGDTRKDDLQGHIDSLCPEMYAQSLKNELHTILVGPISHLIDSGSRIVVIPSGAIANAPFSMLFEHNPLCVVPSLAIFEYLVERSRTEEAISESSNLFLSNRPRSEDGREKSIQYSRIEALYLSQKQETESLLVLSDELEFASLADLMRRRNIVHMCGHSDFNRRNPFGSKTYNTNQPLSLLDWIELNVKANLVVFSSCLSAFTQLYDSGLGFGFSYTLLSTGTRAFVGSLWPVNDQATLLFMMLFYGFLEMRLSPAEALFRAQDLLRNLTEDNLLELISLVERQIAEMEDDPNDYVASIEYWLQELKKFDIRKLRNPAYWAAFSLVGHGLDVLPS